MGVVSERGSVSTLRGVTVYLMGEKRAAQV